MKITRVVVLMLLVAMQGCLTMSNGANWALADFSAYDKNYQEFDVALIQIGMQRSSLVSAMKQKYTTVEATDEYEVLQFEKWRSVIGPDYLEKKLLVKIIAEKVAAFRITNDAVVTNPW